MAKMSLDELVAQLRAAFGESLRAVVLYGSAASGDYIPRKSDYNVLVLVESLEAQRLLAASAAIMAWSDAGNAAPLILTASEWQRSADIFAMEYADVLERHKVLHGQLDTNVRVDPSHLRLQLEHEAMGTLLQLRRGTLAAGSGGKAQLDLLEKSLSTVMVIFRAALRLRGATPPTDNLKLTDEIAAAAGMDGTPFARVIRHKRGESPVRPADAGTVLAGYLAGMQQLVRYLDEFSGRRG